VTTATGTRADLVRALGVLAEPPGPQHARLADLLGLPVPGPTEWTEAFVVQLVPHASIYLSPDGMLGGPAADRIAGFWRAMHMPVPADPDHLAGLFGLYATLVEASPAEPVPARRALLGQARAALLHEHLLSWVPAYAHAMIEVGPPGYAAWAALVLEVVRDEAAATGVPARLPAHLRAVPPATPAREGGLDEVIGALLAPARCGLVLTRGHLAALARGAGLGLRLGERRRSLRALVEQDPPVALAGLAQQAEEWARRHRIDEPAAGPLARHWAERAATTAQLLYAAADTGPPAAPGEEDER
jgi:hypothetical protein